MCWTTKSQNSPEEGTDKVDSNLSLQFWAEKGHTDSLRACLCATEVELCCVSSHFIQHRLSKPVTALVMHWSC